MSSRSRSALHLRSPPPQSGLFGRPPPQSALFSRAAPHPAALIPILESRLAEQTHDINELLIDNQRLATTHVALRQELTAARHDLHLIATDSAKARDAREAEIRALVERARAMEKEAVGVEKVREELERVRADVVKIRAARDEMVERVLKVKKEVERVKSEVERAPEIRAEIEGMHREIQRGRAAVEYEKNAHAGNMEQSQLMEANMVTLAREVEKLRAELANAEKRARTAATAGAGAAAANPVPAYNTGSYGNPMMAAYGGAAYADAYSMQQVQAGADGSAQYGSAPQYGSTAQYGSGSQYGSAAQYGSRGGDTALQYGSRGADAAPQYASSGADGALQYGSNAVSRGPYEMQQAHAHR